MARTPILAAALALVLTPATASEQPVERDCRLFVDQVAARLRVGDAEQARRAIPRLRRCEKILKAALARQTKEFLEQEATRARSRPWGGAGDRI